MNKNSGNSDMIPAGDGIMPCGSELEPASWPSGYCGNDSCTQDSKIPAGDGIKPGGDAPFGITGRY
jgi:hypothetical protein